MDEALSSRRSPEPLSRHACRFYDSTPDLLKAVVPFLRAGLAKGEALIWVYPEFLSRQEALEAFRGGGVDARALQSAGRLELLEGRSWYCRPDGTLKDLDALLEQWRSREQRALERGFSRLRVTGDASFSFLNGDSLLFLEYEKTIHGLIGSTRMTALCTYGLSAVGTKEKSAYIAACHDA